MLDRRFRFPAIHVSSGMWVAVVHCQIRHHFIQHPGILTIQYLISYLHAYMDCITSRTYQWSSSLGVHVKGSTLRRTFFILVRDGSYIERAIAIKNRELNFPSIDTVNTHIHIRRPPTIVGRTCADGDPSRDSARRSNPSSNETS